jgi:hypothetical protein
MSGKDIRDFSSESLRRVSVNRFLNILDSPGVHSGISRIPEFDELFIGFTHCVDGRVLKEAVDRRADLSRRRNEASDSCIH